MIAVLARIMLDLVESAVSGSPTTETDISDVNSSESTGSPGQPDSDEGRCPHHEPWHVLDGIKLPPTVRYDWESDENPTD